VVDGSETDIENIIVTKLTTTTIIIQNVELTYWDGAEAVYVKTCWLPSNIAKYVWRGTLYRCATRARSLRTGRVRVSTTNVSAAALVCACAYASVTAAAGQRRSKDEHENAILIGTGVASAGFAGRHGGRR
jgi:hypothetical protein